jgi:hypothetical protein
VLVPQLAGALGSCLDFLETIGGSLVVDAARMQANVAAYGTSGADVSCAVDELLGELSPYLN